MPKKDLTGQRFGRLVVIREAGRSKDGQVTWLCKCKCGAETVVIAGNLRKENTKSCGCLSRDISRERSLNLLRELNTTHGCSQEPWYHVYAGMLERCGHWEGGKERDLCFYRDRGITVCEEWRNSPRAFGDWLLAHGWRKGLQIDRIDNNKGYCPENCRVVTPKENMNNRRNTLRLDDGTPIAMLCSSIGVNTYEGGKVTPKYGRIREMWRRGHKIHPELMQALKENTDRQSRLLEMTKLRCKRAELMIKGLRELLASKQTAWQPPNLGLSKKPTGN